MKRFWKLTNLYLCKHFSMNYYIKIYDNNHYMEECDAYIDGYFKTHEQALQKAKSIVERSMSEFYKPKMTADELLAQYSMYGEDPAIFSNNQIKKKVFSARDYAETIAREICETKGKE